MDSQSNYEFKRRLETMATCNEFEYGHHLVHVLKSRKELAKRILHGTFEGTEGKRLLESLDYHNNMICEILALPRAQAEKI
jgi:hypothetical protein